MSIGKTWYGIQAQERSDMSPQSRLVAGIVLVIVPTVEIGGASILSLLTATPPTPKTTLGKTSGERATPTQECGLFSL